MKITIDGAEKEISLTRERAGWQFFNVMEWDEGRVLRRPVSQHSVPSRFFDDGEGGSITTSGHTYGHVAPEHQPYIAGALSNPPLPTAPGALPRAESDEEFWVIRAEKDGDLFATDLVISGDNPGIPDEETVRGYLESEGQMDMVGKDAVVYGPFHFKEARRTKMADVACEHCGTYVPDYDAINGEFCSGECADAWERVNPVN